MLPLISQGQPKGHKLPTAQQALGPGHLCVSHVLLKTILTTVVVVVV